MNTRDIPYTTPVSRGGHDTAPQTESITDFSFTHPKNYFGVPLCVASEGETASQIMRNLVAVPNRATRGAIALGLISADQTLTRRGEQCITYLKSESSIEAELQNFRQLKGSTKRFITQIDAHWQPIIHCTLTEHRAIQQLVDLLRKSGGPLKLSDVVQVGLDVSPELAVQFIRDPEWLGVDPDTPQRSIIDSYKLRHPEAYSGLVTYQFKSLLYHLGVLTERGRDTSALLPPQDQWELDVDLREYWSRAVATNCIRGGWR